MRGVDILETLQTKFYRGREGYYLLGASSAENGVFWGEFLTIFEVKEGTPHSDMSGLVVPDTENGG